MHSLPLVSVIIPLFNAEKYISSTIESVINQTYTEIEVLIIDDGSTDKSLEIAKKYSNIDNIKVYSQSNKGASVARNFGLRKSRGKYIQFLDADDLISKDKIEKQVLELERTENKNKLCISNTLFFKDGENPYQLTPTYGDTRFFFSTDRPVEFLINLWGGSDGLGSMIQTNAWVTPIDIIKKAGFWEEFYSPDDDGEFFGRVILASSGIVYVDDCFNYYRLVLQEQRQSNRNSIKALQGCYQSVCLKRDNLFKYCNDIRARRVIARQFFDIAVAAYPKYNFLTKKIYKELKKLGDFRYSVDIGGPKISMIANIFGWKFAKLILHYRDLLKLKK